MKVQTNAGEVELTAEMVRPGMVLRTRLGRVLTLAAPERVAMDGVWRATDNLVVEVPLAVAHGSLTFLGCDPAIAAREDVERYGVAPGIDAGAHGGAVDLEDPESLCRGMVFEIVGAVYGSRRGLRFVLVDRNMGDGNGGASWECWGDGGGSWKMWKAVRAKEVRFVGLDTRHARHEDVERLCCGEHQTEQILDGYVGRTSTGDVCTLAVGDHDTHEDIATGTRWPAAPSAADVAAWQARANVPGTAENVQHSAMGFALDGVGGGMYSPPAATLVFGAGLGSTTIACSSAEVDPRGRLRSIVVRFTVADLAPWRHRLDKWLLNGGACSVQTGNEMIRAVLSAWRPETIPGALAEGFIVTLQEAHPEVAQNDDALRARLREEERARQIARARAGEPEPGTIAWITAIVKEDGYGCYVERARRGPGTVDVTVFGAPAAYCAGLQCRLRDNMPAYVDVLVEPAGAPPDSGPRLDALVAACDMRRGVGETDESLRARLEAYIREEVARVCRPGFATSAHYGPGLSAVEAFTLIESGTHRALDLDEIERLCGKHSLAAGAAKWAASRPVEPVKVHTLTIAAGDVPPSPLAIPNAAAERKAARALAKALRSALPSVDALSWSAADRKSLRTAAHAVCEACEAACERAVPYGVTWGATEMVAALATAAEIGPDAIGQADKIAARVVGYMKGAS